MKNRLKAPRLAEVKIADDFWSPYISRVRDIMIPYQWKILNDQVEHAAPSHCIENFRIAAGESEGEYYGAVFQDTDLAKWLEAVAYSLALRPDEELERLADSAIDLIGRAQQEDGYLDTYYTIKEPGMRWTNLREGHELYTAGHLIEAAVAYYQATGKQKFLKIMCRTADLIDEVFGKEEGKIDGFPGHPEIELALIRLYHVTDEPRYLNLAKYFVDARHGSPNCFDREAKSPGFHHIFPEFEHLGYNNAQAHLPVREQKTADGHAVRAVYLYAAMADLGCECDDPSLLEACRTLYDNITNRQMFLTGSIGAAADGECFTCDYDLPNNYNYSETCASIGLAMFSLRMLQIDRDGKYADTFERALYNTVLGGMALSGKEFFYVNPQEAVPEHLRTNRTLRHVLPKRRPWLGVACCPPNIARTLMSLGQYIYGIDEETVYIQMFISNEVQFTFGGKRVTIAMETAYPYGDTIVIRVKNPDNARFKLAIRKPGWSKDISITQNGREQKTRLEKGFCFVEEQILDQSVIQIGLDMKPMLVQAHPRVRQNVGKAAIVRGPLVYCLEEIDNGDNLGAIVISGNAELNLEYLPDLFDGVMTITANARRIREDIWEDRLYQQCSEDETISCGIRAIPYCLWNNRGTGEMLIWIHRR